MAIYDPERKRVTTDAEHLLLTMLRNSLPPEVKVVSLPESTDIDLDSPDSEENYPLVIVALLIGTDLVTNGGAGSGDMWDVGITCIDTNRPDEPSSHENAGTLSDIVYEKLNLFAKRSSGAVNIGTIHSVDNTQRPQRVNTWDVGAKQRTNFDSRYSIGMRPPRQLANTP